MTILQALVLGVVQGATEFLPISSKTHLVVVPALLGWPTPDLELVVLLHLGTLLALAAYFARELAAMAVGVLRAGEGRRLLAHVALASVPAAVIGLVFERTLEELLSHPRAAAWSLLATAAILVAAEWWAGTIGGSRRLAKPLRDTVRWQDAVRMGLAQALALLPGVSRSGSTMSAGLGGGLRREVAARFSFLMALAAIAGANIVELPDLVGEGVTGADFVGLAASAVVSFAVVAWLLRYLRQHNFLPFAIYCAVFAVVAGLALS